MEAEHIIRWILEAVFDAEESVHGNGDCKRILDENGGENLALDGCTEKTVENSGGSQVSGAGLCRKDSLEGVRNRRGRGRGRTPLPASKVFQRRQNALPVRCTATKFKGKCERRRLR